VPGGQGQQLVVGPLGQLPRTITTSRALVADTPPRNVSILRLHG